MISKEKINQQSTYFRICPFCGKAHMVKNRGRDYCTDKCADDHYNLLRRLKSQHEGMIGAIKVENSVSNIYAPPKRNVDPEALKKNIEILSHLTKGQDSANISIESIISLGWEGTAYSYHYPFNQSLNIFCVEYGPYETLFINPNTIYVHLKSN